MSEHWALYALIAAMLLCYLLSAFGLSIADLSLRSSTRSKILRFIYRLPLWLVRAAVALVGVIPFMALHEYRPEIAVWILAASAIGVLALWGLVFFWLGPKFVIWFIAKLGDE